MAAEWLRAEGLTKLYGGVVALQGASLSARRGEIRGLVGANGAGKSTLVKILTGVVAPTEGRMLVDGDELAPGRPRESLEAGIAAVPQELTIAPRMSVAENVMLGREPRGRLGLLERRELRRRASGVLRSLDLELSPDEPVGRLPLLEQRLVMIARALSINARLVIFDEPTATVSQREVELLLRTIRGLAERDVSVLYVSHRLDEVEQLCDTVTVLRDGRVVAELEHTSRDALVTLLASGTETTAREDHEGRTLGDVVLELDAVAGERLRGVDLTVRAGEIVGLAGLPGSGAREVLLTVCGAVASEQGRITVAGRRLRSADPVRAVEAGVAFLPGDRSLGTFPNHSVRHNVSVSALRGLFVDRGEERSTVAALLDRVALRADVDTPISSLSGGNQQKALVARWIASRARVLLLDDPTAGVDVATRPEIHRQILSLRDTGAAVLLVSTDLEELAELADRVVMFDRGASIGELAGDELSPVRLLAAITRKGETMTAPVVPDTRPEQVAEGVYVIPDQRIDLVPNVGFVVGDGAVLVVDTGMGIANAERVLERASELAEGRPLVLTLTHFHPEHGFGAQVFRDAATIVYNEAQREELNAKFGEFVEMFSGFSPEIAEILSDVERVDPHETYEDRHRLDLGGLAVELESVGPAHTRGDQLVWLPEQRVLFAGDLVENRFFPILPDADSHGSDWIALLERMEEMAPATVVPGHGAVGDVGLVREVREYLEWIRSLVSEGQEKELSELKAELEPQVQVRYPDWDNPIWIGFAIENFRGELDG